MIEKITPSNVTSITTGKKEPIKNTAVSEVSTEETEKTPESSQTAVQVKNRINSVYLQARDSQANMSFEQSRNYALLDVNSKLKDLRGLAIQYKSGDLSIQQQDTIVAQAEQTLYAIDSTAASSQFLGAQVIEDADSRQLGLEVINLEAGDPVGQINNALTKVAAKLAMTNLKSETIDVRLDNIKKSASDIISEFQAEQAARSIINAIKTASVDEIHKDLSPEKVADLLGI